VIFRLALLSAVVSLAVLPLPAQQWRRMEVSRQLRDSGEHRVRVQYGAGNLTVTPAPGSLLYQMQLRYDEDSGEPVHFFDTTARKLTVGLDKQTMRLARSVRGNRGELRLALTNQAPIDLTLDLGAVKADLDLTGLKLSGLRLSSGATEMRVRVDSANAVTMDMLEIDVGAASLRMDGVANLNAARVRANVGVGELEMDFSGAWTRDVEATVDLALGHVRLRIPSDVGVRIEIDRFFSSFERDNFTKRGSAYFSRNWDDAKYHLEVKVNAALGSVEIDHR